MCHLTLARSNTKAGDFLFKGIPGLFYKMYQPLIHVVIRYVTWTTDRAGTVLRHIQDYRQQPSLQCATRGIIKRVIRPHLLKKDKFVFFISSFRQHGEHAGNSFTSCSGLSTATITTMRNTRNHKTRHKASPPFFRLHKRRRWSIFLIILSFYKFDVFVMLMCTWMHIIE
jgi:hypothetical protein